MYQYEDVDEDRPQQTASGTYKVPDKDFYRKNFSAYSSVYNHFQSKLYIRSYKDRRWDQPHYDSLVNMRTPYSNLLNPADGVCCHFLRRGFSKPNRMLYNCAAWSADSRWLILGSEQGAIVTWEGESLKFNKINPILEHQERYEHSEKVKAYVPITAIAWKKYGNLIISGDKKGLINYCDETYRNVLVIRDAHTQAVRGITFSPLDAKLATCGDDAKIIVWAAGGRDREQVLSGHQSDIKCIDWHPYRSLFATGSRDSTLKLWDPREGACVSTITAHKKQINTCHWNFNGNWLASGAADGQVKLYDIRTMREFKAWKGHNSEVTKVAWHPIHETLLSSGGYNGSLAYWIVGQEFPHSMIIDAHRQAIDVLTWHPSGHLLVTAGHDQVLKFWSREPAGAKLEQPGAEGTPENAPMYFHGPLSAQQDQIERIWQHHKNTSFAMAPQARASGPGDSNTASGPPMSRKRHYGE